MAIRTLPSSAIRKPTGRIIVSPDKLNEFFKENANLPYINEIKDPGVPVRYEDGTLLPEDLFCYVGSTVVENFFLFHYECFDPRYQYVFNKRLGNSGIYQVTCERLNGN